jgi:protocatechuate 3,4-dioxygenase beta subunit
VPDVVSTREPPLDYPDYKSTALRHPKQPLVYLPEQVTETTGPQLGHLRPRDQQRSDRPTRRRAGGRADHEARARMISSFSIERSEDNWALAYEFDIVIGGRFQTPIEEAY